MVSEGKFREDLMYRLKVVELRIPPLRERLEDIPLLVQAFVAQFNREHGKQVKGVSAEVLRLLSAYAWPGNVRELRNLVERMVIFCAEDELRAAHLPYDFKAGTHASDRGGPPDAPGPLRLAPGGDSVQALDEMERQAIFRALQETGGNKTQAARVLGIGVRTLHRKLKEYRIQDEERSST